MGAVTNDRDENIMTMAHVAAFFVSGFVAWAGIHHGSIWLQDILFGR